MTKVKKSNNDMATFWAKILLLTVKRQDFIFENYFRKIVINMVSIQIRNWNRKRNFSKVGTGIGTGTRIIVLAPKHCCYLHFICLTTSCPRLNYSIYCYKRDVGCFQLSLPECLSFFSLSLQLFPTCSRQLSHFPGNYLLLFEAVV
jgi:hypothetical protein